MKKMKCNKFLAVVLLLVQILSFQLLTTAAGNPLLLLDYAEIDETYFVVNCSVENIPVVDVIAVPIAYDSSVVKICGIDKETGEKFEVADGVKKMEDYIDGKNGAIIHEAILSDDKWGGALVENDEYPYLSNEKGIITFTFYSLRNKAIESRENIISVYFKRISNGNPAIRVSDSANTVNYDRASDGITFARWGEKIDVEIQYSGDVFDGDYVIEVPEEPENAPGESDAEENKESSTSSSGGIGGGESKPIQKEEKNESLKEETTEKTEEGISFKDVDNDFWAYTPIMSLAENKIINGYEDKTFKPNSFITRAELSKIAVMAGNVALNDSEKLFSDVALEDWYAPYLTAAYKASVIKGYEDNSFKPLNNISRQDLCVILHRAFFANETDFSEITFADKDDISDYAKNAVASLLEKGILNGKENNMFAPKDNATRAETAKIVYLCLNMQEK